MEILCYKDSLEIITFTRDMWDTPGEYTNALFGCIKINCPDNKQPKHVLDLGEPTPIVIGGCSGQIYLSSSVSLEPVPEAE